VARSNALHYYGEYPLKTEIKRIGAIEAFDVGERIFWWPISRSSARRGRVFLEEQFAVVKQDLDQASKEFSQCTDVIGNRP
jgi:hypothetical protein